MAIVLEVTAARGTTDSMVIYFLKLEQKSTDVSKQHLLKGYYTKNISAEVHWHGH